MEDTILAFKKSSLAGEANNRNKNFNYPSELEPWCVVKMTACAQSTSMENKSFSNNTEAQERKGWSKRSSTVNSLRVQPSHDPSTVHSTCFTITRATEIRMEKGH
jgi:hypothetical protein